MLTLKKRLGFRLELVTSRVSGHGPGSLFRNMLKK